MTRRTIARALLVMTATLLAGRAFAQTPAPATAPTSPPANWGLVDFGARGTSITGDGARYERYRDLGDGLFLESARWVRERGPWLFDVSGDHVGRKDQRFTGLAARPGTFKGWMSWDQIPMLMSVSTQTLFTPSSGALEIDNALQAQVQAQPTSLSTVFAANARVFETKSERDIFETGFEYLSSPALSFRAQVRHTSREGSIPYGGSFGHSSLVEVPGPVMHTTNDVEGGAEYSRDRRLFRGGYAGSWFHNDVTQLAFDSPFRATDIVSTPSRGRLSLAPSNSYISVNGLASVRLPARSRAIAYFSVGLLKDSGDPLMPQTINTANNPAPVERTAVEGEARTSSVNLQFVSRPVRYLDLSARFKTYDYDNRTPEFTLAQRVAYDNQPGVATMSSLGGVPSIPVHTEAFGVKRHTFDADASLNLGGGITTGVGYTWLSEDRSHRIIEANTDNTVRLLFDITGNTLFSVRTKYEHGQRSGEATDEAMRELFRIGEQPGMRHFDVASRKRDRVTVLGSVTPSAVWSLNASVAAGTDDYDESEFGLRDNQHRVYGLGVDVLPSERVTVSGNYTFERYDALSRSRQANPPAANASISYETYLTLSTQTNPGVQVADAARNWSTDSDERSHSAGIAFDIARIGGRLDVTVEYDFSQTRAHYNYATGPVADRTLPEEVIVDSVLPLPTQLPPTFSQLHRGSIDFVYALTARLGIGLSAWHEQYAVEDFTLDAESTPNLARGSVLLMGYLYRPYKATTIWGRLIYRW